MDVSFLIFNDWQIIIAIKTYLNASREYFGGAGLLHAFRLFDLGLFKNGRKFLDFQLLEWLIGNQNVS